MTTDAPQPTRQGDLSALARLLKDIDGTVDVLEDGLLNSASSGAVELLPFCAGLRLVKGALAQARTTVDALAEGLAA